MRPFFRDHRYHQICMHLLPMQCSHAGRPEGTLEEQYALLEDAADVIAHAPGDELTAEILALQGELLVQVLLSRLYSIMGLVTMPLHKARSSQAHQDRWTDRCANMLNTCQATAWCLVRCGCTASGRRQVVPGSEAAPEILLHGACRLIESL